MKKVYSCFIVKGKEDGVMFQDHVLYDSNPPVTDGSERRKRVTDSYKDYKLVAYFASTDRRLYLRHLIEQRLFMYRYLYERYRKHLENLLAQDYPVSILEETRELQDSYLDSCARNIGKTMGRYMRLCAEEDKDVLVDDELALAMHDWYEEQRNSAK